MSFILHSTELLLSTWRKSDLMDRPPPPPKKKATVKLVPAKRRVDSDEEAQAESEPIVEDIPQTQSVAPVRSFL